MLRKDLAAALGISGSMVSRLSRRGMPTHDVASARRWRDRHLEFGRMKGVRFEAPKPPAPPPCAPLPCNTANNVAEAFIFLSRFVADHGIDRYGQVLIHLATVMNDLNHERLNRWRDEVPQEVWDAWDGLDELYFAQDEPAAL